MEGTEVACEQETHRERGVSVMERGGPFKSKEKGLVTLGRVIYCVTEITTEAEDLNPPLMLRQMTRRNGGTEAQTDIEK